MKTYKFNIELTLKEVPENVTQQDLMEAVCNVLCGVQGEGLVDINQSKKGVLAPRMNIEIYPAEKKYIWGCTL